MTWVELGAASAVVFGVTLAFSLPLIVDYFLRRRKTDG
jgi:hypothetical protein